MFPHEERRREFERRIGCGLLVAMIVLLIVTIVLFIWAHPMTKHICHDGTVIFCRLDTPGFFSVTLEADGEVTWRYRGNFHRKESQGPSRLWPNGSAYWQRHGKLHREAGPAVTASDGTKLWFFNGEMVPHGEEA